MNMYTEDCLIVLLRAKCRQITPVRYKLANMLLTSELAYKISFEEDPRRLHLYSILNY